MLLLLALERSQLSDNVESELLAFVFICCTFTEEDSLSVLGS